MCSPFVSVFKFLVCVHRGRVCPGSVGTRQALLQGWLCVSALCALQMCLTWCGGNYNDLNLPMSLINNLNICPAKNDLNSGLSLYSLNTSKLLSM